MNTNNTIILLSIVSALLFSCSNGHSNATQDLGSSVTASVSPSVGMVGCSLTLIAVNYAGANFWPTDNVQYADGSVSQWVSELQSDGTATHWAAFKTLLSQYPATNKIWWELCPDSNTANLTYDRTLSVLNEIKALAPSAQIYVSGVPVYPTDGDVCSLNTTSGSLASLSLAAQLVSNGMAKQGPIISALTTSELKSDGCHANASGGAVWGKNLTDLFGN